MTTIYLKQIGTLFAFLQLTGLAKVSKMETILCDQK